MLGEVLQQARDGEREQRVEEHDYNVKRERASDGLCQRNREQADSLIKSFSHGSSSESPMVVSSQKRHRQMYAPTGCLGGRYGSSMAKMAAAVEGTCFQNSSVFGIVWLCVWFACVRGVCVVCGEC